MLYISHIKLQEVIYYLTQYLISMLLLFKLDTQLVYKWWGIQLWILISSNRQVQISQIEFISDLLYLHVPRMHTNSSPNNLIYMDDNRS